MNLYKEIDDIIIVFFMTLILYSFIIYIFEKCNKYYEKKYRENNIEGFDLGNLGEKMKKLSTNFAGDIPECDGFIFSTNDKPTCPVAVFTWAIETVAGYIISFVCCGICAYLIYTGFTKGPGGQITEALTTEAVNRIKGDKKSSPEERIINDLESLFKKITKAQKNQSGGFIFGKSKKSESLNRELNEIIADFKLHKSSFNGESISKIDGYITSAKDGIISIQEKENISSTENKQTDTNTNTNTNKKETKSEKSLREAIEKKEKHLQEQAQGAEERQKQAVAAAKKDKVKFIKKKEKIKLREEKDKGKRQSIRIDSDIRVAEKIDKIDKESTAFLEKSKDRVAQREAQLAEIRKNAPEKVRNKLLEKQKEKRKAATKIQAITRGRKVRKEEKRKAAAATKIQAFVRGRN